MDRKIQSDPSLSTSVDRIAYIFSVRNIFIDYGIVEIIQGSII